MFDYLQGNRLDPGQQLHVGVCGHQRTDDAVFRDFLWSETANRWSDHDRTVLRSNRDDFYRHCEGIVVTLGQHAEELTWGDLTELWPIEQP